MPLFALGRFGFAWQNGSSGPESSKVPEHHLETAAETIAVARLPSVPDNAQVLLLYSSHHTRGDHYKHIGRHTTHLHGPSDETQQPLVGGRPLLAPGAAVRGQP